MDSVRSASGRRERKHSTDDIFLSAKMHSSDFLFEGNIRTSTRRGQRYFAVLSLLAHSPRPLNANMICHRLRRFGTLPSVFYAIKDLDRAKWICKYAVKMHTQGPSGRSSLYDLTPKGLLKALAEMDPQEEDSATYSKLADKYYDLFPGIFALWREVVNAKIEGDAKVQLTRTATAFVKELRNDPFLEPALELSPTQAKRLRRAARTAKELQRVEWICDMIRHTQDRLTAYFLGTARVELRSHAMFPRWFHRDYTGTVALGLDFASEYDRWLTRVGANELLREATVRSLVKQLLLSFGKQVDLANTQLKSLADHNVPLRVTTAEDIGQVQELVDQISSLRTIISSLVG